MFAIRSDPMGTKNPTRRELLEHNFPVRLLIDEPEGPANLVGRAMRRVVGRQAFDRSARALYVTQLSHASGFVCACPEIALAGDWPLRLTLQFEMKQEGLVRDALKPNVGDDGYVLGRTDFHRGGRPAWHLHMRTVWDAVQFMRMAHPAVMSVGRWVSRNG